MFAFYDPQTDKIHTLNRIQFVQIAKLVTLAEKSLDKSVHDKKGQEVEVVKSMFVYTVCMFSPYPG